MNWKVVTGNDGTPQNLNGGDQVLNRDLKGQTIKSDDRQYQPTNLLFKVTDKSGDVTGIYTTELLYYVDANGNIGVEPIFFFVEKSNINNQVIYQYYGHDPTAYQISVPYIGLAPGTQGRNIGSLALTFNKDAFLREPVQAERQAFALKVAQTGDPRGLGDYVWDTIPSLVQQ